MTSTWAVRYEYKSWYKVRGLKGYEYKSWYKVRGLKGAWCDSKKK